MKWHMWGNLRVAAVLFYLFSWANASGADAQSSHSGSQDKLKFNEALHLMVGRQLGVLSDEARLRAKQSEADAAMWRFAPSLDVNGGLSRVRSGGSTSNLNEVEGVTRLNVFRAGADWERLKAARSGEKASEAQIEARKLEAESMGARALLELIASERNFVISSDIVQTNTQLQVIAEKRYKKGLLALEEVHKITVDLNHAQAERDDVDEARIRAHGRVEEYLGSSDIQLDWPWLDEMKNPQKDLGAQLEIERRPDYRVALEKSLEEKRRSTQKFRELFPSIDAEFAFGRYKTSSSNGPGWSLGLSLNIPIFSRFEDFSAYQIQEQNRIIAENDLEAVRRKAHAEWQSEGAVFKKAYEAALTREKNLALSRKLYDASRKRFETGRISANDFVLDRSRLWESERLSVRGWVEAHEAYLNLRHSLGHSVRK